MPSPSLLSKLAFGAFVVAACLIGLTTYTSPVIGPLHDDEVAVLLHRALGDSGAELPGPPAELPVQTLSTLTIGEAPSLDSTPAQGNEAALREWARQRAARDSAALREWLTRPAFLRTTSRGDTVQTILVRVSLRSGCPLLSHLWIREDWQHRRLLEVDSDCPGPPGDTNPGVVH